MSYCPREGQTVQKTVPGINNNPALTTQFLRKNT